ncbi:glyoxylase-like metal-dependent hydrolase (beta-lactamase superfamily II) [Paraburkholderia sp. BL8N3]|jgi:glyoxylase-like metal-dependent hydrolase (beta-lactamase superfamily II)|nr:N-acyl homoserine lactonase family protein [Paraburkholderia sp. BL8N3]TCK37034.1 glyoxylase-like metal-dependent hydrolase (beta-lactamase superfamily II) [Paraburkholderia sp. BL8N3]
MSSPIENYRIFAVKYAFHDRRAPENFLGGDAHDVSMPLDYFVWAVVGESRAFIVDTGFDAEMAGKRGRTITHSVEDGLKKIGIRADAVEDVIITHMHYDHAGNRSLFPRARYHIQDREMAYCTGRCMCHGSLSHPFEAEDVKSMVGRVFDGRVQFHDGASSLTPGLSVHWVGGHTNGLQVVRVHTARGWVVLASDASHFYANMQQSRPFPVVYNVGDMLEGYAAAHRLADSAEHVIPGHDPDVLKRYAPHDRETEGWIARLDVVPR